MAGLFVVSSEMRWPSASWLFDWVLRTIAANVKDTQVIDALKLAVDENFGYFSFEKLTPAQESEIKRVVQDNLVATAERDFPESMPGRAKTLKHVADLVAMMAA